MKLLKKFKYKAVSYKELGRVPLCGDCVCDRASLCYLKCDAVRYTPNVENDVYFFKPRKRNA